MRTSLLALALTASFAIACAGGEDDNEGEGAEADASMSPDSGTDESDASTDEPDSGSTGGATALGQECETLPEDSCPGEHICLPLGDATHPWCSVECEQRGPTDPIDQGCEGYTGPGVATCGLGVSTDGDMQAEFYACMIICDEDGGQCDECDGTCPHGMVCTPSSGGISVCK